MPGNENAPAPDEAVMRPGSGTPFRGAWVYAIGAGLAVLLSWWAGAAETVRILVVWALALLALGGWGRDRLSAWHRSLLAGVAAAAVVHLLIFPGTTQTPIRDVAKFVLLGLGLVELVRPALRKGMSQPVRPPAPIAGWPYVATAGFVSAVLALYLTIVRRGSIDPVAATLIVAAPIGYYLIFRAFARDYWVERRREFVHAVLGIVPVAIAVVTALQVAAMVLFASLAGGPDSMATVEQRLDRTRAAQAINRRVGLQSFEKRLLRRRAEILAESNRPRAFLETVLDLQQARDYPPTEELLRTLWDAYLSTGTLESAILPISNPHYLWRLESLPLPRERRDRTLLLDAFTRLGLLDRLLIEYMECRLGDRLDPLRLAESLETVSAEEIQGIAPVWREYLLGVCLARAGRSDEARSSFRRVLSAWPDYHNALVWLDRLSTETVAATPPTGQILFRQTAGNLRYDLNIDDALWTALEARPGRYRLEFDVSGVAAEEEWPVLQVWVDGSLLIDERVEPGVWAIHSCTVNFERDTCHRLLLGFANDLYRQVGDRVLNRNLYFRKVTVVALPQE